jgi:hypothetical protein
MDYQSVAISSFPKMLETLLGEKFFNLDKQSNIPWIIQLIENPKSPIALPGKISLDNHDCLHLLLNRDVSPQDEAFVIGFTMGNDPKTNWVHLLIFKFFARFLYPAPYKFNQQHLKIFDLGFLYGRKLSLKSPNLNQIDFRLYYNKTLEELRLSFGINWEEIELLTKFEHWLLES